LGISRVFYFFVSSFLTCKSFMYLIIIIIIIIASQEDEMNDKYNDKLCTSNEVISEMSEEI